MEEETARMEAILSQYDFKDTHQVQFNLEDKPRFDYVNYVDGDYAVGEEMKPCKFFKMKFSTQNLSLYRKIARLADKVDCPFLLKPVLVSPTPSKDFVAIGYVFVRSYRVWEKSAESKTRFDNNYCTLNSWWIKSIKRVLRVILEMRRQGVVHNGLDRVESYVVVDDGLCVVNPTDSSINVSTKDLDDFKTFLKLKTITKSGQGKSRDWDDFLALFPPKGMNGTELETRIMQLINHPVLKEAVERLDYFQVWWDLSSPSETELIMVLKKASQSLLPWDSKLKDQRLMAIHGPAFKEIFDYGNEKTTGVASYDTSSLFDLGRYIRNLIKHEKMEKKTPAQIENGLREYFPGYLSFFHSSSARASFKITAMI